jgi:hypothetical protein
MHTLNNLVTAVLGYYELVKDEEPSANENFEKLGQTINKLIQFSRSGSDWAMEQRGEE